MPKNPTLTELAIRAAAAPSNGTITLWDGSLTHFGIRVSPQGTKTFIVLLAPGRRQSIGRFPIITLAQARAKARTILAERTLGRHLPQSISWQTATQQFIDACRRKNRPGTVEQYENLLKRHFPFGTTRLGDISKRDIVQKLDKLDETPSQQAHALVGAKVFFNWAMRRGYVDQNPCLAIPGRKQPARSRVLTDDELKRVWQATEEIGGSFGAIVKLLLLTGQRRGEIAALRWEWIDEKTKTITLPSAITKNKRAHTFPFGDTAAAVLAAIPRPNDYVFPAARDRIKGSPATIFNGWGKATDRKSVV